MRERYAGIAQGVYLYLIDSSTLQCTHYLYQAINPTSCRDFSFFLIFNRHTSYKCLSDHEEIWYKIQQHP